MEVAKESALKLLYEGSVKRVFACPADTELLWFEFTDDYSIFDWGKMPDTVANKGSALAVIGGWFFDKLALRSTWSQLSSNRRLDCFDRDWLDSLLRTDAFESLRVDGCPVHYRRLVNERGERISSARIAQQAERSFMEVVRASVARPVSGAVLGQTLFAYSPSGNAARRLIPLEIVFRFGMPQGSSLAGRLERDPSYARTLGLPRRPAPGERFPHPVFELYTKLEPKDRLLSLQEALVLSELSIDEFRRLLDISALVALALWVLFADKGIELWDGKLEFVMLDGKPSLADSIGPDELRLIYKDCHLSKEMIRQVYRGSEWESSLLEAQGLASDRQTLAWKDICRRELGREPASLAEGPRTVIDRLYGTLANHLLSQPLFVAHPTLDEFVDLARQNGLVKG